MIENLATRLALIQESSSHTGINPPKRKMGRQMASQSFLEALRRESGAEPLLLGAKLPSFPLRDQRNPWEALFTGDPNLAPFANERHWNDPRRYSLLGITHTLSTPGPLQSLSNLPQAPLHNWDALICTSHAAKSAIEILWEHSEKLLRLRGGKPAERPQLPVIPLGIHAEAFRPICSRQEARRRLELSSNAAVVLWTGRLELHCKAHHGSSFRALAHAAAIYPQRPWVLLMYGTAVMPSIPAALKQAAAELCPNVTVKLLDGHDLSLGSLARAASDMALSLVDCLQETFGLTPVEAMASGLPVVVSDWNGYRDTVVEGRTGHRIVTQSFQPGWSDINLQQLALSEHALDQVSAQISGQINVNAADAGAALARLAASPELAVAMGALGIQRVQNHYDWKIVLKHYSDLLDELADRRRLAMGSTNHVNLAAMKPIPPLVEIFKAWPSKVIDVNTSIQTCGDEDTLVKHLHLGMVVIYRNELPPSRLILKAFNQLQGLGHATMQQLKDHNQADWSPSERNRLAEAVGWLLKHGFAEVCP